MAESYSTASVTVTGGTTVATFTVKRSGSSAEIAAGGSVNYETWDGTAAAGTDYTTATGTLSFAPGVTEAVVTVPIIAAAYDRATHVSFYLALVGYGTATCTIEPTTPDNLAQTYLAVPDWGNMVAVPTSSASSDTTSNLYYQTVPDGFSAPTTTPLPTPIAYIRLGFARADLNDYERVVIGNTGFVPYYKGKTSTSGKPDEIGPLAGYTTPRGLEYPIGDKSDMASNTHLDGIQIFSNKNYLLTVNGLANTVINGSNVVSVAGTSRELFGGSVRRWVKYSTKSSVYRQVTGSEMIRGFPWSYEITNSNKLSITTGSSLSYSLTYSFKGVTGAELTANMAAKYTISNSIAVTVKGLDLAATCDITGRYKVEQLGSEVTTSSSFNRAVSKSITLSVTSVATSGWTKLVQPAAALALGAGVSASIPGWMAAFEPDGKFYSDATADDLGKKYSKPFFDVIPKATMTAAGLAAVALVVATFVQKKAQVAPSPMPKIQMDETGMELSCGTSVIRLSPAGITLSAPLIDAASTTAMTMRAGAGMMLDSPNVTANTSLLSVSGTTTVQEGLLVGADIFAFGMINASFVNAG